MLNPSVIILLFIPRLCFFCESFLLFVICVCLCCTVLSVHCSLVIRCWERVVLLALLHVLFSCFCHYPIWCPGSGVVLIFYRFLIFALFDLYFRCAASCSFFFSHIRLGFQLFLPMWDNSISYTHTSPWER